MVAHNCYPSYVEGSSQSQSDPGQMQDPVQKITKAKKDSGYDSSGRVLIYQVQGPEFKL
jgi:hypothetical protein